MEIPISALQFSLGFLMIEWMGRDQEYAIAKLAGEWPLPLRWLAYYALIFTLFSIGYQEKEFIYFKF